MNDDDDIPDDAGALPPDDVPDPLAVRNPELEAEHAAALDDLGGAAEPPGEADTETLKLDHAEVLDGLSSALAPSEPAVDSVKDVAAIPSGASKPVATKESTGRYYVPPRQRTPSNRAERRQAVQETTRHQEANQPSDFPDFQDEGHGDEGGGGQRVIEMLTRTTEGLSSTLIDAIRRLELVEQLLERERL